MNPPFPNTAAKTTQYLPQANKTTPVEVAPVYQPHSAHHKSGHLAHSVNAAYYTRQPQHATSSHYPTPTNPKSHSRKYSQMEKQPNSSSYSNKRKREQSPDSEVSNKRPRYNDSTRHREGGDAGNTLLNASSSETVAASKRIKELAQSNKLQQAEDLLQKMQEPNQQTFQPLLSAYAKRGDLDAVQRLFNTMRARSVSPNKYNYNAFIQCTVKANNIAKTLDVFKQMQKGKVQPDVVTYNILINAFINAKQIDQVPCILIQMQQEKVEVDIVTYGTLINYFANTKQTQKALAIFEQLRQTGTKPNVVIYNTLINAFAENDQLDQALNLFKEMQQQLEPDVTTYTNLMKACVQAKDLNRALTIFNEMCLTGLQPDVVLYTILIKAFSENNNTIDALAIFKRMQQEELQPDVTTYNTLINAFAEANNPDQAMEIFGQMRQQKLLPNVVTYNALMNAFVRTNQVEQVLKIFKEMGLEGIKPNIVAYSTLINAFAKTNSPEEALKIFEEMQELGIQPNLVTYNTLINAFAEANNQTEALRIFEIMKEQKLQPDRTTYTTLIKVFSQAGNPTETLKIFEKMQQQKLQPDLITYTTLINALAKTNLGGALAFFKQMEESGIKPDAMAYNTLMNAYAEADTPDADQALHIYETMIKKGITPNPATYSILLKTFVECGRAREGLRVVNPKKSAIKLDEIGYQTLFFTHIKLREPSFAEYWLHKMMKEQYKPAKSLFLTLARSFLQAGDTTGATRVENRMRKAGYQPSPRSSQQSCCPEAAKVSQQPMQIESIPLPPLVTNSTAEATPVVEAPVVDFPILQTPTVVSDSNNEMLPQGVTVAPSPTPITEPAYHFILDQNQSLKCVDSGVEDFASLTKFPITPSADVIVDPNFAAEFEKKLATLIETQFEVNPTYEEALKRPVEQKILPNGIEIRKVNPNVGYGVFTTKQIKKGTILGEYTGKITTWEWLDEHDPDCSYSFECSNVQDPLFEAFAIDGCMVGNFTRFFNHGTCKERNLRPVHYFNETGPHILFEATRSIKAGEQLCFNYGPKYWKIKGITPTKM